MESKDMQEVPEALEQSARAIADDVAEESAQKLQAEIEKQKARACKKLPSDATKEERRLVHQHKMAKKKVIRDQITAHLNARARAVQANLGKNHPNHGKHPQEAY